MGGHRIENYLHLNTSFTNHLGLLEGKSASVLYFLVLEDTFYVDDISFSFLEELLGQVSMSTPMGYGDGLVSIFAELDDLLLKTLPDAIFRGSLHKE